MNPILRRVIKVLAIIIASIYLPYLFGKMYNAIIYSKLGSYYATHTILENWVCGLVTTTTILFTTLGILRIFRYIKYGN